MLLPELVVCQPKSSLFYSGFCNVPMLGAYIIYLNFRKEHCNPQKVKLSYETYVPAKIRTIKVQKKPKEIRS